MRYMTNSKCILIIFSVNFFIEIILIDKRDIRKIYYLLVIMLQLLIWTILLMLAQGQMPSSFDYLSNIDPTIIQQPRYAI